MTFRTEADRQLSRIRRRDRAYRRRGASGSSTRRARCRSAFFRKTTNRSSPSKSCRKASNGRTPARCSHCSARQSGRSARLRRTAGASTKRLRAPPPTSPNRESSRSSTTSGERKQAYHHAIDRRADYFRRARAAVPSFARRPGPPAPAQPDRDAAQVRQMRSG